MSIKFKHFCIEPFKELLLQVLESKDFTEEERLTVWRFKNMYNKEIELFAKRWQEIYNKQEEELTSTENEEEKEEIRKKHANSLQELLECESELKQISYDIIKKAKFSPLQFDLLEPVVKDLPIE